MRVTLFILQTAILLSPILFQIIYTKRALNEKGNLSIFMTFLWTLVLIIFSTISTCLNYLEMIEFAKDSEKLTDMSGILVFVFVGIITAFMIAPVIGLIGLLNQNLKKGSQYLENRSKL